MVLRVPLVLEYLRTYVPLVHMYHWYHGTRYHGSTSGTIGTIARYHGTLRGTRVRTCVSIRTGTYVRTCVRTRVH